MGISIIERVRARIRSEKTQTFGCPEIRHFYAFVITDGKHLGNLSRLWTSHMGCDNFFSSKSHLGEGNVKTCVLLTSLCVFLFAGAVSADRMPASELVGTYINPQLNRSFCRGHNYDEYAKYFFGHPVRKNSTIHIESSPEGIVFSMSTPGVSALKLVLRDNYSFPWVDLAGNNRTSRVHPRNNNGGSRTIIFDTSDGSAFFFSKSWPSYPYPSFTMTIINPDWCEISWDSVPNS